MCFYLLNRFNDSINNPIYILPFSYNQGANSHIHFHAVGSIAQSLGCRSLAGGGLSLPCVLSMVDS